MTEKPFTTDYKEETDREKRKKESLNLTAYLGYLGTCTDKFLEEGMSQEHLEQITLDKIRERAEKE